MIEKKGKGEGDWTKTNTQLDLRVFFLSRSMQTASYEPFDEMI